MGSSTPAGGHQRAEGAFVLVGYQRRAWLGPLVRSFRRHNPRVELLAIPYEDPSPQLRAEADTLELAFAGEDDLGWCDELARAAGAPPGVEPLYRKLAAFWGPFERFVYLDTDVLVLTELAPVFAALRTDGPAFLFAHGGDRGGALDEVYRPGPWRDRLVAQRGTQAGNTGVWAARRDLFSRRSLLDLARAVVPVAHHMAPTGEQPFLNFCLDHSGIRAGNVHDVVSGLWIWAGVPGCRMHLAGPDSTLSAPGGTPVGLVHWAGYYDPATMPYRELWAQFAAGRGAAVSTPGGPGVQRPGVPGP